MSRHSETEGARPPPEAEVSEAIKKAQGEFGAQVKLTGERARRLGGDYLVEGLRARLPVFPVFSSANTPEKPR